MDVRNYWYSWRSIVGLANLNDFDVFFVRQARAARAARAVPAVPAVRAARAVRAVDAIVAVLEPVKCGLRGLAGAKIFDRAFVAVVVRKPLCHDFSLFHDGGFHSAAVQKSRRISASVSAANCSRSSMAFSMT